MKAFVHGVPWANNCGKTRLVGGVNTGGIADKKGGCAGVRGYSPKGNGGVEIG